MLPTRNPFDIIREKFIKSKNRGKYTQLTIIKIKVGYLYFSLQHMSPEYDMDIS